MMRRVPGVLFALTLAACTSAPPPAPAPAWERITLPSPGRVVLRDAAVCAGRWYVVGARLGASDDDTSPAAWSSDDGRTWRSLRFAPSPRSLYGPRDVISSVGCAGARVALIGAKGGGAHGNPRVSTWLRRPDGAFAEIDAPFETYGGDRAVNVARMAGADRGFVIAGNRTGGAAAWLSTDGTGFRLYENAPGLASDPAWTTVARDALASGGIWVVAGGATRRDGTGTAAVVWTSADGARWARRDVASDPRFTEVQRIAATADGLIAVGPRGTAISAWHGPAWTPLGSFGTGEIRALAVTGNTVLVAGDSLWRSGDGGRTWRAVRTPGEVRTVAARDGTVLVAGDDGAWLAGPAG